MKCRDDRLKQRELGAGHCDIKEPPWILHKVDWERRKGAKKQISVKYRFRYPHIVLFSMTH